MTWSIVAPKAYGLGRALLHEVWPYRRRSGDPSPVEVLRRRLDAARA